VAGRLSFHTPLLLFCSTVSDVGGGSLERHLMPSEHCTINTFRPLALASYPKSVLHLGEYRNQKAIIS
jgi:hypothetical protein